MSDIDHLAEVRAALAAADRATPGPWQARVTRWSVSIVDKATQEEIATTDQAHPADLRVAAAIVALRNAAGSIAALVEEMDALRSKLAEARRLGLEACETTDEAIDCPLDADTVGRIGAKATAIRTALEAL